MLIAALLLLLATIFCSRVSVALLYFIITKNRAGMRAKQLILSTFCASFRSYFQSVSSFSLICYQFSHVL